MSSFAVASYNFMGRAAGCYGATQAKKIEVKHVRRVSAAGTGMLGRCAPPRLTITDSARKNFVRNIIL
jgi:hypothetical protein